MRKSVFDFNAAFISAFTHFISVTFNLLTISINAFSKIRGGLLQGVKKRARLKVRRLVLTGHGQVQLRIMINAQLVNAES